MRISGLRALTVALCATALTATTVTTPAVAATTPLAPRTQFTMAPDGSSGLTEGGEGIPDIDVVRSTIRTYYNAPKSGADVGIADKTSSPYISEMERLTTRTLAQKWLRKAKKHSRGHGKGKVRPAIVLDADDTTLWTYDMEDHAMGFNFDPALQNTWVQDQRFPATPSMVTFVNRLSARGFAVFGLTGRNDDQKAATLANLRKVGYTQFGNRNFFTKWTGKGASQQPRYVRCNRDGNPSCSTVEYKAMTRKHIESLGYDIVLNVGDQWSDLQGGHADHVLKLPNPTYNLPSTDLDGTPANRAFSPRSHFTMAADGSSGATEGGEGIPNIDIDKATIRRYYGAGSTGIADKTDSPYIRELAALENDTASALVHRCSSAITFGVKPAVVLDADDTTLWTYDMEDNAMHFNFSPTVQDQQWVQPQRFPATPGMPSVVQRVQQAGCTVIGLTGRNDDQKAATLGNLAKYYGDAFTEDLYFTKWVSGKFDPATRPWMVGTACGTGSCSTVDYKSLTRKHIRDDLGYAIVGNLGDQFSDLLGGDDAAAVKLPNPTYYLP
jgi:predicted secreted acid phosphatase